MGHCVVNHFMILYQLLSLFTIRLYGIPANDALELYHIRRYEYKIHMEGLQKTTKLSVMVGGTQPYIVW